MLSLPLLTAPLNTLQYLLQEKWHLVDVVCQGFSETFALGQPMVVSTSLTAYPNTAYSEHFLPVTQLGSYLLRRAERPECKFLQIGSETQQETALRRGNPTYHVPKVTFVLLHAAYLEVITPDPTSELRSSLCGSGSAKTK